MLVDKAAVEARKVYKKLSTLPDGASIVVSTSKRMTMYVSINGVDPSWLWHAVTNEETNAPELVKTPEALEFLAEVERIAQSFRTVDTPYHYDVFTTYDYKIKKPELVSA